MNVVNTPAHEEMLQLSVVLVNYRTPELILDCLVTLLPDMSGLHARVVVVDNHSDDDSSGIICSWLYKNDVEKKVMFIQSETNSGFAGGNNLGIRSMRARHYLLLNSDTLVRSGAVATLLETAAHYSQAGIMSPRLEWCDGTGQESCFRFHTPLSELIDAAKTSLVSRLLNRYVVALPVQREIAIPQWTSFACVLIRDEVFQQIGLLDDGYFMYFEDVEFCLRAHKAGWQIIHNPAARIVHLRGGSSSVKESSRLKKRMPRYYYESRTRFYYQAHGWIGLTAANLFWWLGRLLSFFRQMAGRRDKAASDKQWIDIWTNWLDPLKPYTHPSRQ